MAKGGTKEEEEGVKGEDGEEGEGEKTDKKEGEGEAEVEEAKTEETPEPALTPTPTPPGKKAKQAKATKEESKKAPNQKRDRDPAKIPEPKTKVQQTGEGPKTRKRTGGEPATFARRPQPTSKFGKVKWNALKEVFLGEIKPKLVAQSVGYSSKEDLSFHGLSQFNFVLKFFLKRLISYQM